MRILNLNTFGTYFVDITNFAGDVRVPGILGLWQGIKYKVEAFTNETLWQEIITDDTTYLVT